jgi:hypothetical protein
MSMFAIHKTIVTNSVMQPIAVQIDYADWLKIEQLLETSSKKEESVFRVPPFRKLREQYLQENTAILSLDEINIEVKNRRGEQS